MSKTKKSGAGHYEILFIIPNKFTEDEAKQVVSKVEGVISSEGGKITYQEFWGKKKLAYKIKQNEYGYYSLCEFDIERDALAKVEYTLRLSTDVLRHQIVVKKAKTEEEIKRDEAIRAKIDSKKAKEAKELKEEDEKEKAEKKKTEKKKADSDEGKTKLKDLDEKLDDILNTDDLI